MSLYTNMLRTSRSFDSYNFRQYFVRKTKDTFKDIQVRALYCRFKQDNVSLSLCSLSKTLQRSPRCMRMQSKNWLSYDEALL